MPVVIPIVAGVISAGSAVAGAVMQANAAAKGGEAQQGIADSQRAQAVQDRAAAMQLAQPTAQELQQISDRIQTQQRYQAVQKASLDRDTQILNQLDPALATAGKQANDLMQGKSAAILAPMKQMQDFEKNQMKQKLAAQFGPGYASSSVGQQALMQFDMQSNMQLQQAQMQSFQQVSQFLGYGTQARTGMMAEERQGFMTGSEMSAQTLRSMADIQSRGVNAFTKTADAMQGTAGSQFVGQAASAKAMSGLGESIGKMGGALGGMMSSFGSSSTSGSDSNTSASTIGASNTASASSFTMPKFGSSSGFARA